VKLSIQHMRTLAWLGLFAMLMIFIAPSISTHLAKNSMDNSEMTGIPMSAEHAGHRTMMSQNLADSPLAEHNMADMSTGDCFNFCGYCSLFHHSPPLVILPSALPAINIQRAPSLIQNLFHIIIPSAFPPYQTRAPPFTLINFIKYI
jgi:hypothetical protein